MYETDNRFCHNRRILMVQPRGIWAEDIDLRCGIGRVGLIPLTGIGHAAQFPHTLRVLPVLIPERQAPLARKSS